MLSFLSHFQDELIEDLLTSLAQTIDLKFFSTYRVDATFGPGTFRTNYPDAWRARYLERGYAEVDPVLRLGNHFRRPVTWDTLHDDGTRDFFGEATELGLGGNGYSVPILTGTSGHHLVSLNYDAERGAVERNGAAIRSGLFMLSHLLHENGFQPDVSLKGPDVRLSAREREVLLWAAAGKTSWETGEIIGVTEKTVFFYLSNACKKLGAANKTHAVAISLSRGLLSGA